MNFLEFLNFTLKKGIIINIFRFVFTYTRVVPVKLRRPNIRTHNALYRNFAKAGVFSVSIPDDRVQNKVSTMKCLQNMVNNVQTYASTPI